MTVVDFRSGGYDDSRLDETWDQAHHGHNQADQEWSDQKWDVLEDWDEGRFATPQDAALSQRDTLLGRVARLTHYLGALVSVLLMVSLCVWGYRLVVRDVSGVPVIRAIEGEARTAPDEPGGELSERTGLAVNQIAGGSDVKPAATVAIAPAPTTLADGDVAMGELGATARESTADDDLPLTPNDAVVAQTDAQVAADRAEAEAAAIAAAAAAEAAAAEMRLADTAVLSDAPAAEAPVNEAVTDLEGAQSNDAAITAALAEAGVQPTKGALAISTRPAPRPRRVAAPAPAVALNPAPAPAVTPAPADRPAEAATAPVTSAKVASGAPLVQIGAFDSDSIAASEWDRVSGRYGALFAGKSPVVQRAETGGRTFWRLRVAGFESRNDARRFCAALIEAGTDCIPAVAK